MLAKLAPALLILAACQPATAQQDGSRIIAQMEQADANKDGAVSRQEFTTFRSGQFARLDRNKDGFVAENDIPGVIRNRLPPELSIENLRKTFDTNKDSKISQSEFVNGPTLAFDRVDANKDGVATRAELDTARAMLASRQ